MHENHPIRQRVSSSFPPHSNGLELDWEQFQDWNEPDYEDNQNNYIQINSNSDSSPEPIQKKRKRRKTKHKKKKVSQLFNITTKIAGLLPSLKIKKIQHEEYTP